MSGTSADTRAYTCGPDSCARTMSVISSEILPLVPPADAQSPPLPSAAVSTS